MRQKPHSFLTGRDPFFDFEIVEANGTTPAQEFRFESRHEGFIGIPHGGLAMGLCLDSVAIDEPDSYPLNVKYKFGGTGISIGDTAVYMVDETDPAKTIASITKIDDKTPYLKAEISRSEWAEPTDRPALNNDARPLPYYRNCFVCGHHREVVGLQRRFHVHNDNLMSVSWGADDDIDRGRNFLLDRDLLHPAVITSILDENTAWSGFMATKCCGLSVRVEIALKRPIKRTERLKFIGWPAGVKGNPKAPRFYIAEGAALAIDEHGHTEVVAKCRGEWLIVNHYTEQIKQNLLPENDWEWIFE
jgi:hypothetical protein